MKDFKPKTFKDDKHTLTNFRGLCKGCGLCLELCPKKCLKYAKEDLGVYGTPAVEVEIDKCIGCKICERICPDQAISVEKSGATHSTRIDK